MSKIDYLALNSWAVHSEPPATPRQWSLGPSALPAAPVAPPAALPVPEWLEMPLFLLDLLCRGIGMVIAGAIFLAILLAVFSVAGIAIFWFFSLVAGAGTSALLIWALLFTPTRTVIVVRP